MPEQENKKVNFLKMLNEKYLKLRSSVSIGVGRVGKSDAPRSGIENEKQSSDKKFKKFLRIIQNGHYALLGICLVALLSIVLVAWSIFYFQRPVKLVYNLNNLKIDSPITVNFSQPIQKNISYNITPSLKGVWKTSRNIFGVTTLSFYPSHPLVPGSSFQLTVSNVTPLLASQPSIKNQSIPVIAEKPATISAIMPATNAVNVSINTTITVKLASPNHGLRKLVLTADASLVSSEPTTSDETTFVWKFAQPLHQGQLYHLTLSDLKQIDKTKQLLFSTAFTTVPEPHVVLATNSDHFYPGDKIVIAFDQDMKKVDGNFKFGFAGSGFWQDSRTYIFTPSGLNPGTSYSYTVLKGSASIAGGVTEADHVFNISPPGAVYVIASNPKGDNVALGSSVDFTFDQPVDHSTAQTAFSIDPNVSGSFSWAGNTMSFHPASLDYQTGYMATIGSGIKGIYGLASTRSFSNSFTTTYRIVKLGVPYFRQAYALSCEEASLRMALAYRGINVSDYDILTRAGYSPRPRDPATNSWDNPFQMYVGDVSGSMGTTGWGAYGPPIAAAAQSFGQNASYVGGISVNQIAQAIYDNNPVVLWGIVGSSARSDSWNTSSGIVEAPRNTHVRTVYGVAGSADNPVGFYVHDPLYGDLYWTTSQLQLNMSFGNSLPSQGVIVY